MVQGLDLGVLVDAEDDSGLGWVEVETDPHMSTSCSLSMENGSVDILNRSRR
jgi:hypothetical protein